MLEKRRCLVAGLGNPGDNYRMTRHNVGFMVIDKIAETFSIPVNKKKFDAMIGRGHIENVDVILTKPMLFMNRSGAPIHRILTYFGISSKDMLIIHDDIDLTFGRIKLKEKGGHGGHKGIKSLVDVFGGGDFARLRIGVGRPEAGIDVTNHVLGRFREEEMEMLNMSIKNARDAVVAFLIKGIGKAMNKFNHRISN
jgi:PTH1 family peptidyl-tRNA hydrolase